MKNLSLMSLVIGGTAVGILANVTPASALTFNVSGTNYDIVAVTDTGANLSARIQSTPWWGTGSGNTINFVNAVGSSFGFPNAGGGGSVRSPLFSYQFQNGLFDTLFQTQFNGSTFLGGVVYSPTTVATYALINDAPASVPFEFNPVLGVGILGGLFAAKNLSKLLKK